MSDFSAPTTMQWRGCVRFPGYQVSECGDLRRISTMTRIKGHLNFDGYPSYHLKDHDRCSREVQAHTLVAEAFLGPKPGEDFQVCHRNGSRLNCHFSNLRWGTSLQNHDDRRHHGTGPLGEKNPKAKLSEDQVRDLRIRYRRIKDGISTERMSDLDYEFGLCRSSIIKVAKGKSWPHIPMPGPEDHKHAA